MTAQNKKIAIYAGSALVIGAVGFFVYSFFKKTTIPVYDNTSMSMATLSDQATKDAAAAENAAPKSKGTSVFAEMMNTKFAPIVTPNLLTNTINSSLLYNNLLSNMNKP